MKKIFTLFLIVINLSYGFPVFSKPKIYTTTKYYNIKGNTAKELRKEIDSKGQRYPGGKKRYPAFTKWHTKWEFKYGSKNSKCYISQVTVTLTINYTYPKWINKNKASKELQKKWDTYIKNLITHEKGHAKIAQNAAAEVEKAILNTPMVNKCEDLGNNANKIGKNVIKKWTDIEIKYDKDTKHGLTQGAKFP